MKKIWLFSSYNWQGNPKALFLYMSQKFQDSHECWWISESKKTTEKLKEFGILNIISDDDKQYQYLIQNCDVYITENFRENYPVNFPKTTKVINTWHGVGLKHIELALGEASVLSDSIVRKYIRNYSIYKNQTFFLATSEVMENHFIEDTVIDYSQMIRGPYPRNIVYNDVQSYDIHKIFERLKYNRVILFCPTYRVDTINGVLQKLIPDFNALYNKVKETNDLFIVKVHPFMKNDPYFIEMEKKYCNSSNVLFWDDLYDIYEIFNLVDIAIIDYSSIFYDLLEANVSKFIRYIPDFEEYTESLELIGDYHSLTTGIICNNFDELLNTLKSPFLEDNDKDKDRLLDYFFAYSKDKTLDELISQIDHLETSTNTHKQLHSFDVFDTLIRRTTLAPYSVFALMQKEINNSTLNFPQSFKDSWIDIRHKVEIDVRDMFRKTTFERGTDKIEISFNLIYERLQKNYRLSDVQINFLTNLEIQSEIAHVEPIQSRIDYLFEQLNSGHDVILISDMYLPEAVIKKMLIKADTRLGSLPLYLSSSIGHQKSTGKLYKHIFFEKKYQYEKWVHYGDNAHADGVMPRKLGIETRVHHMDSFIPFENKLIQSAPNSYKYEAYQLATLMHRYRQNLLCDNPNISNEEFEKAYYAYAYAGTLLVPYVHWSILDAIERGYETLYFISRDGHYLKLIADELIRINGYNIKSKFIYGSRKVWRLPSYINEIDDEMFGPFGNFVGMDCFDDLVRASYLEEEELLTLFPEFENLKSARHLRGQVAENIRDTLSKSHEYRKKILTIAAEKRELVRKYLQENIDFNEKFAFVEFWGRGYTQDTFTRLLNDAAPNQVVNPFYYIRSFKPETSQNIRHNFVLAPINFSFFEPLFASTPYKSISEYVKKDSAVEAVINPSPNEHYLSIEKGLIDFTANYLNIQLEDPINFARIVNQHSYSYQLIEKNDQFMCNVFSRFKDNISSFGLPKEYAPILTIKQLEFVRDKKDLEKITSSPALSLARSNEKVREFYQKIYKKMKLPAINITGTQYVFPENDLTNYIRTNRFPLKVVSIKNNSIYQDIGFTKDSKRLDKYLEQFEIFEVTSIEFLKNGIPRLVTPQGYVTANRDWVLPLEEAEDIYVRKNEYNEYEAIIQTPPKATTNNIKLRQPKPMLSGSRIFDFIEAPYKAFNKNGDMQQVHKKWNKFTRDPHKFFADAKNDKLILIKHLFNEDKIIGKKLSNWIRKNL